MNGESDLSSQVQFNDQQLIDLINSLSNEEDLSSQHNSVTSPFKPLHAVDEGIFDFPDLFDEQNLLSLPPDSDPIPKINNEVRSRPEPSRRKISRSSDEGIGMSTSPLAIDTYIQEEERTLPFNTILHSSTVKDENEYETKAEEEAATTTTPGNCKVCLEKAGKHSYYGGRVCPSCRAFFRRAVQSKYYEIFFCSKGEKCEINLKTRRSCQYCRFKKCLQAGMRIAWVLPDGERNRRFNKLNKAPVRNQVSESKLVPVPRNPVGIITKEEWAQINQVNQFMMSSGCRVFKEYAMARPDFIKEMATVSYFGGKMSYEFFRNYLDLCDRAVHEVYTSMEEFKQLPFNDRKKLIQTNAPLMNTFKGSNAIQEESACIISGIESLTKSGDYPVLNEVNEKLKEMNLTDRKPIFAYNQFFVSPWAANYEDEERHFELTKLMKAWPRDNPDTPVDDVQMTLMKLIMAFNSDFVDLERPDIVQSVQLRYVSLLQKYLKFKYGKDANKRFGQGLMMSSYAREANEIMDRKSIQI